MECPQKTHWTRRLLRPLAVAAIVCFALQVFSDNKADVDLWGNVGFVTALPWQDGFHRVNTFGFTDPNHAWINHEWLAQYIYRRAFDHFGSPGLLGVKLILGFGVLGILAAVLKRDKVSGPVQFFLLLLTISTMGYGFSTRPHHFTYLALAGLLYVLKYWPTRRWLYWAVIPGLMIVWANLHGAFFSGILVLVAAAVFRFLDAAPAPVPRRLTPAVTLPLTAAALAIPASLVNPYGKALWGFIAQSAATPRPYLSEWAPLQWHLLASEHVDFLVLLIVIAVGFVTAPKPRSWFAIGLTGLALASAILLRRNIPLFAMVATPLGAGALDRVIQQDLRRLLARVPTLLQVAALALFIPVSIGFALTFHKTAPTRIEVDADRFPTDVMAFVAANAIRGNALVFFDWAEYAIWHLHPDWHVFLDGRFLDAYSETTLHDYLTFLYDPWDPGWDKALVDYPTDIVLVHQGNPACRRMRELPDWAVAYETPLAVLFLRRDHHAAFWTAATEQRLVAPTVPAVHLFP